jgi:hypothetical protein
MALASVISVYSNPLIEGYTEMFYVTDEGDIPSSRYKIGLRTP